MPHDNHSSFPASVFADAVAFNLRTYQDFMAQVTADNAKDFTAHHTACKAALAHIEALLKLHQLCAPTQSKNNNDVSEKLEPLLQQARNILSQDTASR